MDEKDQKPTKPKDKEESNLEATRVFDENGKTFQELIEELIEIKFSN